MEAVVGLLLMLLGVSHAVETYCDGRQDGAQCYGALGGTVVLQLMDNASEIFRYQWSIKTTTTTTTTTTTNTTTKTTILTLRKNVIVFNAIAARSSFTPSNGTFMINDLKWDDGGEYELETFDSDGKASALRTLQLTIQAPVSSPPMRTSAVDYIICGVRAAVVVLALIGIAVYFAWKEKKYKVVRQKMERQENSVVMVEMRS